MNDPKRYPYMADNIVLIPLTQGQFAFCDIKDYDKVKEKNWYYTGGYACHYINQKHQFLHNILMPTPPLNHTVDHRNRNTLDNRMENLRYITQKQQSQNRGIFKNNKSGYKGVCFHKTHDKYMVQIRVNSKFIYLGYYDSAVEAAQVYDIACLKYFGEFALTNKSLGLL